MRKPAQPAGRGDGTGEPGSDLATQAAVRQALLEMQRYLADEIAPLMAVDAANLLLRLPPRHGAVAIRQWVESQLAAPDRAVTVAGYLFHAVKKFHLFSEFDLVDRATMARYLTELCRIVVQLCPEREQADLRQRLGRLGESRTTLSAPVRLLNREVGSEEQERRLKQILERQERERAKAGPPGDGRIVVPHPRVALLMDRLDAEDLEDPRGEPARRVLAPLLTRAAVESRDPAQLQAALAGLKEKGIEPRFDWMFRLLGGNLPGWHLDPERVPQGASIPQGRPLEAMHRIVALAGSGEEGRERYSGLVYAAIEQLNEGHLAQAVAMFDVAARLREEGKVDADLADLVVSRAQESVSEGPLRKFASAPSKHGLLRKVLRFFPAFAPESLLGSLDGEPKRERRKLLLSLVEVHGPDCRPLLLERLEGYRSGTLPDPRGFYSRNVVFLLRRLPRRAEDDQLRELELLAEFSRPGQPFMVTKEAVGALALLTMPRAERVLVDRLAGFEFEALNDTPSYDREEVLEMLDRTCAALVRLGTPGAVRAVVDHAFRTEAPLGDTLGRLEHLSGFDLAEHREQLERLLRALREALPAKLLGVAVGRRLREIPALVRAVSGTPAPEVRGVLEDIVSRYPGKTFAEPAAEALARLAAVPAAEEKTAGLVSGDLELFGLPTLLQSLADAKATGRLVVTDRNGHDRAAVFMAEGAIIHCGVGRLRGLDAVCQLFERPQPGSFRFERPSPGDPAFPRGERMEVVPTVLEAMRRHDEFQEDRALVPDGATLMPTGVPPTTADDEADEEFVEAVWREARRGTAPESCEGLANGDAYRVRRLFAHWLEGGALRLRPAA